MELALSVIHIHQSGYFTRTIANRYWYIEGSERNIGFNTAMDSLGSVLSSL